jgi:hypothetical protein
MAVLSLMTLLTVLELGAQDRAGDVAELTRLETVWNEAHLNGDGDALDRLWAEDIVVTVQAMPVMSKDAALAMTRSGRMKFDRYETSDLRIRVYDGSAVVTGRVQRARRLGDRTAEDNWFFTKVYVRRDDRWQVVSWHGSDVPHR